MSGFFAGMSDEESVIESNRPPLERLDSITGPFQPPNRNVMFVTRAGSMSGLSNVPELLSQGRAPPPGGAHGARLPWQAWTNLHASQRSRTATARYGHPT